MIHCLLLVFFVSLLYLAQGRFHCHNNCGGKLHGYCNYDQTCVCKNGWSGFDCSQKACPYDIAWADKAYELDTAHSLAQCSNRGICNTNTGKCNCFTGFTGIACQKLTCGDCSGRGECKTLQEIYEYKQTNSGISPIQTFTPWEFNHTTACVCDFGYSGPNCEYKLCPKGDDPVTAHTGYPKVLLALDYPDGTKGLAGHFLVNYLGSSFRFPPQAEAWNASECKASFESLPNIDKVNCTLISKTDIHRVYSIELLQLARYPYENNIYSTDGQFTNFNADPPSNPMNCDASFVNGTSSDLVSCAVTLEHNNATYPEYVFCSNRGLCDFKYGVCTCYENFGNSDCSDYSVGYGNYSRLIASDVLALQTTNSHFVQTLVSLDTVGEGTSQFDNVLVKDSDSTIFTIDGYGNVAMNYGGLNVVGTLDTGGASVANAGLVVTGGFTVKSGGMKVTNTGSNTVANGMVVTQSGLQITGGGTVYSGGLFVVDGATLNDKGMRVDNGVTMFSGGVSVSLGGMSVTGGATVAGGGILINKHGSTVLYGGLYVYSGGLTLNGIGSGLEMPNGQTVYSGGIWVTGGASVKTYGLYGGTSITGMTVKSGGFKVTDGFTLNSLGFTATDGLTIQDLGLMVTGGLTVVSGNLDAGVSGMLVSNGASVSASGLVVTNGLTLLSGGLKSAGSLTVSTGSMVVPGNGVNTAFNGASAGYVLITGGLLATGGYTINDVGFVVTNGLTVSNGGLTLNAAFTITGGTSEKVTGGLTISSGGFQVNTKGLTVTAGGMVVSGGASISGVRMVISGGLTVPIGGANLFGLSITQGGLKITNGLTVNDGGIKVTTGGFTVVAGGFVCSTTAQSNQGIQVKLAGVTITGAGLTVANGITMTNGGFASADGGMTVKVGAMVTGGVTVADSGIMVTTGGLTVQSGGLVISDLVSWDAAAITLGGITVMSAGMSANAVVTIGDSGLVVGGASSVDDTGVIVTTSGLSINSGGMMVVTDGLTVKQGGLSAAGGLTIYNANSAVAGRVFVTPRGSKADQVVISDLGIHVTGGLSVVTGPSSITGNVVLSSGGLRVSEGLLVDNGMQVTNGGLTVSTAGLSASGGMTVKLGGLTSYGGLTVNDGGVRVKLSGASITDGASADSVNVHLNGLAVTDGMTVALEGMQVANGLTVGIGGVVVVTGGLSVVGGLMLSNLLPLTINDGLFVYDDYTGYDPVYWETAATIYSDRRLKRNITTIDDALDKVSLMRGVYYRWKDDVKATDENQEMNDVQLVTIKNHPSTRHVGFVAQEIQSILPEVTHVFDDEGHIGVRYDDMAAVVLEAVRILDKKTQDLQAVVEANSSFEEVPEEGGDECLCREEMEAQLKLLWKSIEQLEDRETALKSLLDEAERLEQQVPLV